MDISVETITPDELRRAFGAKVLDATGYPSRNSAEKVEKVIDWIASQREPEYVDAGIYFDAEGDVYMYEAAYMGPSKQGRWFGIGDTVAFAFTDPVRPLTLAVAEVKK